MEYPMPYASCLVSCSVVSRCSLQLSLYPDLAFCSFFCVGYFCIVLWDSLSGLCALWDSLSSFSSLQLGKCILGWLVWPVIGYPLLGVHPSMSIVRLIVIGYYCNHLDGQLNYWASAHRLIGVTTMYQLCDQWLCHSTLAALSNLGLLC